MADPESLPKVEQSFVSNLLDRVPPVASAITIAKRLNDLLRRKTADSLTHILNAAAVKFDGVPVFVDGSIEIAH